MYVHFDESNNFQGFTDADHPDYLFGSKKRKKAAAAANIAMAEKILASGQQLTNSQIQAMQLSADGKISARDKKIIKQAQKLDAKTDRVEARAETKQVRATEKFKSKTEPAITESMETPAGQIGTQSVEPYNQTEQNTAYDMSSSYLPDGNYALGSSGMPIDINYDEILDEDNPTGDLIKTKTLENATVKATDKKDKNLVFYIIACVVLAGILYFLNKQKKK